MYKLLFMALMVMSVTVNAQKGRVGINTENPKATLDITVGTGATGSAVQGVLFPRITTSERNVFVSPQEGLMIYNVDDQAVELFNGSDWVSLNQAQSDEAKDDLEKYKSGTFWVSGVTPPKNNEWISLKFEKWRGRKFLPWTQGCGWYDCNKTYKYEEGDSNLCWAAAAANFIHWWADRNKIYIEKYLKMKGEASSIPSFIIEKDNPKYQSMVYKTLVQNFKNKGGYLGAAVDWFIKGFLMTPNDLKEDHPSDGGFFKGVYPDGFKLVSTPLYNAHSINNFSKAIKEGLEHKQAISLKFYIVEAAGRALHLYTVWGAEFNDEGIVDALYIVDNNDSDKYYGKQKNHTGYSHVGIYKIPVFKKNEVTYIRDYYGDKIVESPISEVYYMNAGTDAWKKYFETHH